jgi:hypothetical protein
MRVYWNCAGKKRRSEKERARSRKTLAQSLFLPNCDERKEPYEMPKIFSGRKPCQLQNQDYDFFFVNLDPGFQP